VGDGGRGDMRYWYIRLFKAKELFRTTVNMGPELKNSVGKVWTDAWGKKFYVTHFKPIENSLWGTVVVYGEEL
jgi:hypothetical protein